MSTTPHHPQHELPMSSNPVCGFLMFPQEQYEEIVEYLDLASVLSLRSTCKCLLHATDSRKIWKKLALELQSSKPEEPLEDYTPQELQAWVLRRYKVQNGLRSKAGTCFRGRQVPGSGWEGVTLIPGGRWLLFSDSSGTVFFTDCDAPRLVPQVLIPFEDDAWRDKTSCPRFVVWTDHQEPRLALRIAVIQWGNLRQYSARPRIEFSNRLYKVDLEGHGSSAKLVAQPLRQFQGTFPGTILREDLNDRHFVQLSLKDGEEPWNRELHLQVYDYANPSSATPLTVSLGNYSNHVTDLYMLPGNRFAVGDMNSISIYAVPTTELQVEMGKTLALLHTIQIGIRGGINSSRSSLHVGHNLTTIVYRTSDEMFKAMQIPHQACETPTIWDIGKCPRWQHRPIVHVGLYGSIARLGPDLGILDYSWEHPPTQLVEIGVREFSVSDSSHPGSLHAFDREMGRAVVSDWYTGTFVYDVAL